MKLISQMQGDVLACLRSVFPLCEVEVRISDTSRDLVLRVVDSGGLVACEIVRETGLVRDRDALWDAIARLADVFETPSHWMAL